MSAPNDIILYHYSYSPYAKRIIDYLALRGIVYAQCVQPPVMPRADLELLNIKYRRIPLMAIGNHVYADTRLIIRKLEEKFPEGRLGSENGEERAIERLLSRWMVDGGVFLRGSQLIPMDMPLLKDPKFQKDRSSLLGNRDWSTEGQKKGRPEALVHIRDCFEDLEHGLLADGREWVLKTPQPSLGDVEAVWPFDWLVGMKTALPQDLFSKKTYPRVFAWIERYQKFVRAAKTKAGKPTTLKGAEAAEAVVAGNLHDKGAGVDVSDPLGLKAGAIVTVTPTDYGFTHRDTGRLMKLTKDEAAIEIETKTEGKSVWLHVPRWGFRIQEEAGGSKL